jgi:dihydrofolate reductase
MPVSRIEGYAIISQDGMIADHAGRMPDVLQIKADQEFFHAGLDRAAVVVHGRRSHEGGPNADRRFRLIVTSRVPALATHERHPNALWWNPAGVSLTQAWSALGAPDGMLAVIGGAKVYELFWESGYDAFHLTRVARARLPGGRPVFCAVAGDSTPEAVLASRGLIPGPARVLDAGAGVTLVSWGRRKIT